MAAHSTDWLPGHIRLLCRRICSAANLWCENPFRVSCEPTNPPSSGAQQSEYIWESCTWASNMLIKCKKAESDFFFFTPQVSDAIPFWLVPKTTGIKYNANKKIMSTASDTGRGRKLCVAIAYNTETWKHDMWAYIWIPNAFPRDSPIQPCECVIKMEGHLVEISYHVRVSAWPIRSWSK